MTQTESSPHHLVIVKEVINSWRIVNPMPEHKYILGDSRSMEEIPDETVNLVVTSPPYWNLKDYEGGGDEIGQGDALRTRNIWKVYFLCSENALAFLRQTVKSQST